MGEGFILIAWERSVSVWGKLLNISPFLLSASGHPNSPKEVPQHFPVGGMFNVSHGIKQCLGGILLPYNIWKSRCCKLLQEKLPFGQIKDQGNSALLFPPRMEKRKLNPR